MKYSSLHTITKKECSQYQILYVSRHNDWVLDMGGGGCHLPLNHEIEQICKISLSGFKVRIFKNTLA
jgi:hypothetical protein